VISPKIAQQIWQIQLKTKKALSGKMLGDRVAISKGAGFDFDQVREYVQGDDLRFIDWKSTARSGKLLTKQYFEERNFNIVIALDISSSSFMAAGDQTKYYYASQIAAIFALVAQSCKDNVGLILFSDQINLQMPIKQGRLHVLKLLENIFTADPKERVKTNLELVFKQLAQELRQKSLIILLSDLIDNHSYEQALKQLKLRHDIVVVRCLSDYEKEIENVGLLPIIDPETGEIGVMDTRFAKKDQSVLNLALKNRLEKQDLILRSNGIDLLSIKNWQDPVMEIVSFFCRRLIS
jgi:uncharacterized protein (DUF58 family)